MSGATKSFLVLCVLAIFIAAGFFVGVEVGESRIPEAAKVANLSNIDNSITGLVDFDPFWKAWNIINDKYVPRDISTTTSEARGELFTQEMVWGAITGLADSLDDPYTVFLPPRENEYFKADIAGNFTGVGMEIGIRDNLLTVVAPLKGTPAERAGMEAGDRILEIDGTGTAELTIEEAVDLIRGPEGTDVVLMIFREGVDEPMEITITREIIVIPSSDTEVIGEGVDSVFVISLYNFSAPTPEVFRQALLEFAEHTQTTGGDKMIIDLRNNPGGFLEAAVDIASWFLPEGKAIVTEYAGKNKEEKVHRSRGYNAFTDQLKLAIIVNRGSASASEILAGALRDHGKATVVGEKSFGKGSVQELIDLTEETSLKVTIARWLLPAGESISGNGLTPAVLVEIPEEPEEDVDYYLETAVHYLQNM